MNAAVPVIDLGSSDACETRAAVDAACREWGFFQVVGHGVDPDLLDALRTQMYVFFAQPRGVKCSVARSERNPWGYYDRELTKNTRDWKEIYDFAAMPAGQSAPRWPSAPHGFRATMIDYYHACEGVAMRLLHLVAANLGMPSDALDQHFVGDHSSFARLNHYPICANPERPDGLTTPGKGHMGVNYHTDAGALTVLLQDERGLEVFRDGRWTIVEPIPEALVINIGDIVQVWSNDRYVAPLHRVLVNSNADRFSAVFFLCPSYATTYAPLPSVIDAQHPARYRPINWGEFYSMRTLGDYADHGEEIQISQFRIGGHAA